MEVYLLIAALLSVGVISAVFSASQQEAKAWGLGGCCRSFGGGNSGGSTISTLNNLNIHGGGNTANKEISQ